jgi:3-oxoacyl-[acyl-carrier protein] reductase
MTAMDLGLAGRVYLVTGGSRGLGLATAKALVADGALVVIAARDDAVVGLAVESLGGTGNAVGLPTVLADGLAAERLVAAAVARFGRLDGALLSVGGPPPGTATAATDVAWREGFESVFLGPLRVARACVSALVADPAEPAGAGPSLVFVASTSARSPIPGLAISNGLRAGLVSLAKDLSDELGPRGIRVNSLLPGRLATDRTIALDSRVGSADVVRRRQESRIPLGRYGEPEEFGRVAAFLLSPASSYLTGTALPVDGGALRSW